MGQERFDLLIRLSRAQHKQLLAPIWNRLANTKKTVVFPRLSVFQRLVAFPLVLPMGWKNSPPIFCTATETIADLANNSLKINATVPDHYLSLLASTLDNIYLQLIPAHERTPSNGLFAPKERDPFLSFPIKSLSYIDVFVDDFIGLAQPRYSLSPTRQRRP